MSVREVRPPGYTSHPMKRSLYREYRPQTFSELVGQDHVARTHAATLRRGQGDAAGRGAPITVAS